MSDDDRGRCGYPREVPRPVGPGFFDRDARRVAKDLLGKVIRRRHGEVWLSARIIETEAYYRREKGSHASLGRTKSREALFMPPGTIYMYYARGGDSLNVSCRGEGNAVLVKSAFPHFDETSPEQDSLPRLQANNPSASGEARPVARLTRGQTLLCRALDLRVPEWDRRVFDPQRFYIEDVGARPEGVVIARRLGIPPGRDEHLMYRFIDLGFVKHATENPLTKRRHVEGEDYRVLR